MLPKIPYQTNAKQNIQTSFSGINFSDAYSDGALSDSKMISVRRYPYLSSKLPRYTDGTADYKAIYSWNGLWTVNAQNNLSVNGLASICTLTDSYPKYFIPMYQKMVILPDKIYIDTSGTQENWFSVNMELTATGTGATITFNTYAGGYTPVLTQAWTGIDFTLMFKKNDFVLISGFSETENNGWFRVEGVTATTLSFLDNIMAEEEAEGTITILRPVPSFDYACEHDNRLWGCKDNVIYCSALGDPTNFHLDAATSSDSYQMEVASEGAFTGCASLSGSVIFFKENSIVKILGNYASNFLSAIYRMNGVKSGCNRSVCAINETLVFMGVDGVYSYSGGTSQLLSSVFGEKRLILAVAGTDGENYYLCGKDAENADIALFMTYNVRTGIWLIEDDTYGEYFTLHNGEMKFLSSNKLYLENDKQKRSKVSWSFTFKPYFENVSTSKTSSYKYFGTKNYSFVYLRTEMERGAWCKVEVREDGGVWRECGVIAGKTGLSMTKLPINRCDKYELRISGYGEFTLLNLEREYRLGSTK